MRSHYQGVNSALNRQLGKNRRLATIAPSTPLGFAPRSACSGRVHLFLRVTLKQLREAGLLERERRGAFSYYRLVPGVLERVQALLAGPALQEAV